MFWSIGVRIRPWRRAYAAVVEVDKRAVDGERAAHLEPEIVAVAPGQPLAGLGSKVGTGGDGGKRDCAEEFASGDHETDCKESLGAPRRARRRTTQGRCQVDG